MNNMKIWDSVATPPKTALKEIIGGRLKGKTDINPQWRYQVMTEQFGICGIGWKYEIADRWTQECGNGEIMCFVNVNVFVKIDGTWSDAIVGTGGSMLITNEKNGVYNSDEGYKMATTDALSVAMKMLGIGATVYLGQIENSKYSKPTTEIKPSKISDAQVDYITKLMQQKNVELGDICKAYQVKALPELTGEQAKNCIDRLKAKE